MILPTKKNIKQSRTILMALLLVLFCLIPAKEASAAGAKRLFTLVVNDGFTSQKVPVYQYSNGVIAAKKSLRTLNIYAGAQKAVVTIQGKTSYYKSIGTKISCKKSLTLSTLTTMSVTVKLQNGSRQTFRVTLNRPAMPEIISAEVSPSSDTGWLPSSSKLALKVKFRSDLAIKAYYKVTDSNGKLVYKKVLGTRTSGTYTSFWDGKPSSGNAAGLSASGYVLAGSYKMTVYLQYKVGAKNKYIKQSQTVTVKAGETAQTPEDTTQNTGAWSWKTVLSGNDTLDYLAETICRKILTDDMSELERARAIYSWCASNLKYLSTNISWEGSYKTYMDIKSASAKAAVKAYGKQLDAMISAGTASVNSKDNYFGTSAGMISIRTDWATAGMVQRRGNCLVMSIIYITLCRHAGLNVDLVENDGSAGHHFWNVIQINGKYYMADVNQASSTFFLRGTKYFYGYKLYSTVINNTQYAIAKKVQTSDCPGR